MKRICIALDTSPSAEKIATLGFEYAKALKAKLVLVHVVSDAAEYAIDFDPIMDYSGSLIQQNIGLVDDFKTEAGKFLKSTANFLGEPEIEIKVLEGEPDYEILKFLKEWKADLLIMGTHSHSIIENVLMGNTAVRIVKHSTTPILIVPIKKAEKTS
ncbi:universal stress protein [Algibacter sp. L1A34]|uniref:universal stress protein n=1 Tax=Algibacter sp. L1A34 TaxID=2686365 RepID=UPI00131B8B5F|nr:universal stress protein [Algibacter sp. L1A34]